MEKSVEAGCNAIFGLAYSKRKLERNSIVWNGKLHLLRILVAVSPPNVRQVFQFASPHLQHWISKYLLLTEELIDDVWNQHQSKNRLEFYMRNPLYTWFIELLPIRMISGPLAPQDFYTLKWVPSGVLLLSSFFPFQPVSYHGIIQFSQCFFSVVVFIPRATCFPCFHTKLNCIWFRTIECPSDQSKKYIIYIMFALMMSSDRRNVSKLFRNFWGGC